MMDKPYCNYCTINKNVTGIKGIYILGGPILACLCVYGAKSDSKRTKRGTKICITEQEFCETFMLRFGHSATLSVAEIQLSFSKQILIPDVVSNVNTWSNVLLFLSMLAFASLTL